MSRLRGGKPARHWDEQVVIRSVESRPADPLTPLAPAAQPRVAPPWLVAVALLLACAATASAALWWQHRSRIIEVTRHVQPYYTAGADAAGCPIPSRCRVTADLGQPLTVLARRLFPRATVLSSLSVVEVRSDRTVRAAVVLLTPSGLEVAASTQCIPGAGPIPGRAAALPAVGPAQADFVVAGAPGCSVAVAAQIPRSVPVPLAELRQLADDPKSQLTPGR
jgi:hypothetical protein